MGWRDSTTIILGINTEKHVSSFVYFLIVLPTLPLTEKYLNVIHLRDYQADFFFLMICSYESICSSGLFQNVPVQQRLYTELHFLAYIICVVNLWFNTSVC